MGIWFGDSRTPGGFDVDNVTAPEYVVFAPFRKSVGVIVNEPGVMPLSGVISNQVSLVDICHAITSLLPTLSGVTSMDGGNNLSFWMS